MEFLYNKKVQITAKLAIFTAAILWVLIWVYVVMILGLDFLLDMVKLYGEVDRGNWLSTTVGVWYGATTALIGAWVAKKAFQFVLVREKEVQAVGGAVLFSSCPSSTVDPDTGTAYESSNGPVAGSDVDSEAKSLGPKSEKSNRDKVLDTIVPILPAILIGAMLLGFIKATFAVIWKRG